MSNGLFLALQQHQVWEDPVTKNALGPRFDIRPSDTAAFRFHPGWLGFQLEEGQQEPFPLARGQGRDNLIN